MDFLKLLGMVFSILCSSRCASELFSGQRICRRGTEWPCYKIVYIPEVSHRLTFGQASVACRSEGGELLSVETENEQRLIDQFVQQLPAIKGYFWIGLHKNHDDRRLGSDCSAGYRWLDGSQATFRNWLLGEPSCGHQACVLMRPEPPRGGWDFYRLLWSNGDCSSRNHFICKYSKEKPQAIPTAEMEGITDSPGVTFPPNSLPITTNAEDLEVVSQSTGLSPNLAYIIWPTVSLLVLPLMASGVICFRFLATARKAQVYRSSGGGLDDPSRSKSHYVTPDVPPCGPPSQPLSDDYENLQDRHAESGFVTNDIYEACHGQGQLSTETGWVENEIYG